MWYRPFVRVALVLLLLRIPGTLIAFLLQPDLTFVSFPFVPTPEGQYLIKDLVLFFAAMAIGGSIRHEHIGLSSPVLAPAVHGGVDPPSSDAPRETTGRVDTLRQLARYRSGAGLGCGCGAQEDRVWAGNGDVAGCCVPVLKPCEETPGAGEKSIHAVVWDG
jgi:hypothetical protein